MRLHLKDRIGFAALCLALSLPVTATADLSCVHLPQLFAIYLKRHYSYRALTEQLKVQTVDQFIKDADPSKTLLLASDVDTVRKSLMGMFTTLQSSDCSGLDKIQALLTQRAKENEEYVKSLLGASYKLDENVEITLDPKKRGYPKTLEERQESLRKMVHFQVSNFLLTDMKLAEAKKQLIHRYELITKRISERKTDDRTANFVEAFAQGLDPHSSYLSKDSMEDFQIQMHLSLEGIGASLSSQDGFTVIEELIPGGSADRTKQLRPKDKIVAVAQDGKPSVSVIDMELREVVKLIRGKKGTKVKLTILRQEGGTKTFDITIQRAKIDIKEQAAKITYETRKVGNRSLKIGVIELPSFYGGGGARSCSNDVRERLAEAKKENVDGIVLNLSRNGGGLLEEAVKISGLFLNQGAIVATKDNDTTMEVLADEETGVFYSGPLLVLTSRLSASASEILAGALKDYRRALIVGNDHTFGKGTVQVLSGLPMELGGMKVTTGMFFLPGGASTQHTGVASDLQVPALFSMKEVGEDTLDYSLPPQSVSPFLSAEANETNATNHWQPIDASVIPKLAEKSRARIAKDAKFAEIKKTVEESEKAEGVIKLKEYRKKSEAENREAKLIKKKTGKEAPPKSKEFEQAILQEGVNILIDLITVRG